MKYQPKKPKWLYTKVKIQDLGVIQSELIEVLESSVQTTSTNSFYYSVSANQIAALCPNLILYLYNAGIANIFQRVLFSTDKISETVHVDSAISSVCSMALNIPLIECADSYLAFYSKKSDSDLIFTDLQGISSTDRDKNFAIVKPDDIEEIARVEYLEPMLVNTSVLNKGIVTNPNRRMASIRFTRELTVDEVKKLGIKSPFKNNIK